ncbi:MAG TPA: hypothetical protein VLH15_01105 [Dehalococcoidales bacterium]|nr:hypothetical protein [Dehalococcoidales bacterium]
MDSTLATWLFIGLIVALLVWNITRRRKSGGMNVDIAMGILANIDDCLRTIEAHLVDPKSTKKFANASWKAFGKKTGFLNPELAARLAEVFAKVEELNQRIETARKTKMLSTLEGMPLESLKAPLLKAREGLMAWIKTAGQDELKGRRGCLGF